MYCDSFKYQNKDCFDYDRDLKKKLFSSKRINEAYQSKEIFKIQFWKKKYKETCKGLCKKNKWLSCKKSRVLFH